MVHDAYRNGGQPPARVICMVVGRVAGTPRYGAVRWQLELDDSTAILSMGGTSPARGAPAGPTLQHGELVHAMGTYRGEPLMRGDQAVPRLEALYGDAPPR